MSAEQRRRPRRARVRVVLALTASVLLLVAVLVTTVPLPSVLGGTSSAVADSLGADLQRAATAQAAFRAAHGRYAPAKAGLDLRGTVNDLVVLTADADGYCLAARHAASGTVLFSDHSGTVTPDRCD